MISCANKILRRSNKILSRRNKLKNKTRMSLPGLRINAINVFLMLFGFRYFIYTERNFKRKMKFIIVVFHSLLHKRQIIHDTMHGNNKSVASLISYITWHRHKRGVHSNYTSSDFALEVFLQYTLN